MVEVTFLFLAFSVNFSGKILRIFVVSVPSSKLRSGFTVKILEFFRRDRH